MKARKLSVKALNLKPLQIWVPEDLHRRIWMHVFALQAQGSASSMTDWVRRLILEALPEEEA